MVVGTVPARMALVVVALVAGAWLVLSLNALDLRGEGDEALDRLQEAPLPPAEVDRARDALQDARRLQADGPVLIAEGRLMAAAGRPQEARAVARRVVAIEPDNDQAWFLKYLTANEEERPEARRRLADLNPFAAEDLP